MINADPYNLDNTEFAKVVKQINVTPVGDDAPDEPEHPLRSDKAVVGLCDYLHQKTNELFEARKPDGGMSHDAYFQFNEGLMLRPEVVAKIMLDYIKQHSEIITVQ